MKQFFKKNWLILMVLLIAVVLRIKLSSMVAHEDLITQTGWGKQISLKGTLKDYYEWKVWGGTSPNHPPLISWLYWMIYPIHSSVMHFLSNLGNFIALNRLVPTKFLWLFDFAKWFGLDQYGTTSILSGVILILKQFMIVADLLIGGIIYYICKKNNINWKKWVLLYLFLPFSWFLSSAWGQSDQLSFLFLIIAFLGLASKKYAIMSPLFYAIAANLKPNCILLLPIFLYSWYKQKHSGWKLIIGGLLALIFSFWTVSWVTDQNVFNYTFTVLINKLSTGEGLISYNAFNFWYIFYPFSLPYVHDDIVWGVLSAKNWGLLMVFVTTILSLKVIKNKKIENIFAAMFVAGFGSWLFMTGMHERYSFLAIVPLFLYSIFKKKYLKYFLILSTIFTLNLFIAYWPYEICLDIKKVLELSNFLIARILSLINLLTYIKVTYLVLKQKE